MTKAFACTGALASALALAAGGCGGGSKGLSKDEYAARLNRICADYNRTIKRVGTPTSPAELAAKGPKLIAEFDKALARVKKLTPPKELKADVDTFLSEYTQLRGVVDQIVQAAKRNETTKIVQLAAQAEPLNKDTQALGKKLGAPACAAG